MTNLRSRKKRCRQTIGEILCYRPVAVSRATVRRYYAMWRDSQGIPRRCDNTECLFHAQELRWLGRGLPLILDHVNGNKLDNSPDNLRYLCPNCDAQLSTRGGKNRGRVLKAVEGMYVLSPSDDGQKSGVFIFSTPGEFHWSGTLAAIALPPVNLNHDAHNTLQRVLRDEAPRNVLNYDVMCNAKLPEENK